MIRSLLFGLAVALLACVAGWFIIPASTYVEDALGILMLIFGATAVIGAITHYVIGSRRKT
jgi:hypothetical protein